MTETSSAPPSPEHPLPRVLPRRVPNPDPTLDGSAALLFDHAPVGMSVRDADGYLLYANPALARALGLGRTELERLHVVEITHPDDIAEDTALFTRLRAGEIPRYSIVKRCVTGTGATIPVLLTVAPWTAASDGRPRFLAVLQSLSHLRGFRGADSLGFVDEAAWPWEAPAFHEALHRQLLRSQGRGERAAIIVVDLDPREGAGEPPLAQGANLSAAVRAAVSATDVVARLDESRFAIIRPHVDLAGAEADAAALVQALQVASDATPGRVPLAITAGIAPLTAAWVSPQALLAYVSMKMLQAKRQTDANVVVDVGVPDVAA
ncbi:PAS domain S-box protein [Patulibacter sp. SYSU D01012]|uniref:PAS domain S-box protein n=1 Tax=Patulibacter sp. SYSU D01012 TaxID=2817381 RepID=UPI001B300B26|nr:PAS domain S-box protein [Patulibacter sp. SYSU D01012]